MEKYAYVTALTTEEYIPGCLALARSLVNVGSKYKLIVMIPEYNKNEIYKALECYGFFRAVGDFVEVSIQPNIDLSNIISEKRGKGKYSFWENSFFKLQAAQLFQYEKIILLDCDQMAVRNIDHLFMKKHMTATTCGRCIHPDWLDLSAGLIVMEPSQNFYSELIGLIKSAVDKKYSKGLDAGDQDVFNEYIPDWKNRADLYIPEKYNICWGMIDSLCKAENVSVADFYMIHFPGKEKPWHRTKMHYIRIFIQYLLQGKHEKLLYKVKTYKQYRELCCPKK